MSKYTRTSGFTLIELLVVVAIIAILCVILLVQWTGARQRAYDAEAMTVARNSAVAAGIYFAEHLTYRGMTVGALEEAEPALAEWGRREHHILEVVATSADRFNLAVVGRGETVWYVSEQGISREGFVGGMVEW